MLRTKQESRLANFAQKCGALRSLFKDYSMKAGKLSSKKLSLIKKRVQRPGTLKGLLFKSVMDRNMVQIFAAAAAAAAAFW